MIQEPPGSYGATSSLPTGPQIEVRPATIGDRSAIWRILEPIVRAGRTLALPRDWGEPEALAYWFGAGHHVHVAHRDGRVLGSYYVRANQLGGGGHVANCGYATAADAAGTGVASAMCRHSQDVASELGFTAMQFNFVVGSNVRAVKLWTRLGFAIVGTIPGGFIDPECGAVDALVMWRRLDGARSVHDG